MARERGVTPPVPAVISPAASSEATSKQPNTESKSKSTTQLATPPSSVDMNEQDTIVLAKSRSGQEKLIRRKPVQTRVSTAPAARPSTSRDTRNFSGDTLVDTAKDNASGTLQRKKKLEGQVDNALDMGWEIGGLVADNDLGPNHDDGADPIPSSSKTKSAGAKALETISGAAGKLKSVVGSVLGKRSREPVEPTKDQSLDVPPAPKRRESGRLRASMSATPDISSNVSAAGDTEPYRRARPLSDTFTAVSSTIARYGSKRKRYELAGLYAGQEDHETDDRRSSMPLPMFGFVDHTIDFKLPYDVFAPLRQKDIPKDWRKLGSNRFIDDAKELWRSNKLAPSDCGCKAAVGCDEGCLNRTMLYECDANNCSLSPEQCTNREFSDLAKRMKKGGPYDHGIETFKTKDRGYGVRANRTFAPGQIIVEYCGEVITPEECDRRMNNEYKDKDCYYLMDFDQGMIIDATRGNIARFVNHACEPNCRMEKRIVKNEPRMALFAGPNGIMTGEELTYDYNFDNFSKLSVQDCRCGSELCRGKLDRRDHKKEKSLAASIKRKAAELAADASSRDPDGGSGAGAACPSSKPTQIKKRKTARWSKGWSYIDPEMEMMRLQEDALEKGKQVDVRQIEKLQLAHGEKKEDPTQAERTQASMNKTASLKRQSAPLPASATASESLVSSSLRPQRPISSYSTASTNETSNINSSSSNSSRRSRPSSVLGRAARNLARPSTSASWSKLNDPLTNSEASGHAETAVDKTTDPPTGIKEFCLPELDFSYKSEACTLGLSSIVQGGPSTTDTTVTGNSGGGGSGGRGRRSADSKSAPVVIVTTEIERSVAPSVISSMTAKSENGGRKRLASQVSRLQGSQSAVNFFEKDDRRDDDDGEEQAEGSGWQTAGQNKVMRSLSDAGKKIGKAIGRRRSRHVKL